MVINCFKLYAEEVKKILFKNQQLIPYENRIAKNDIHKLEVKDIEDFKAKSYPIPYKYQIQIREEI